MATATNRKLNASTIIGLVFGTVLVLLLDYAIVTDTYEHFSTWFLMHAVFIFINALLIGLVAYVFELGDRIKNMFESIFE